MPRTHKPPSTATGRADIIPTGTYSIDWLRSALGLGYNLLRKETRAGRLRAVTLGKNQFVQGEWWLEWLHAFEATQKEANGTTAHKPPRGRKRSVREEERPS
jgi:hypothetical protein